MASYTVTAETDNLIQELERFLTAWEADKLEIERKRNERRYPTTTKQRKEQLTAEIRNLVEKWTVPAEIERHAELTAKVRNELSRASLVSVKLNTAQWMASDADFNKYYILSRSYELANHAITQQLTYCLKEPQEQVDFYKDVQNMYLGFGLKPENTVMELGGIPNGRKSDFWKGIDHMMYSGDPIQTLFARTVDYAEVKGIKENKRLPFDSEHFPREFRNQRIEQAQQYAGQNAKVKQTLKNSRDEFECMLGLCSVAAPDRVADDITKLADRLIADELDAVMKANITKDPNAKVSIGEAITNCLTGRTFDAKQVSLEQTLRTNYRQIYWDEEVSNQDGITKPLIEHVFDYCKRHAVQHTKATLEKYAFQSKRENWTKDENGHEVKGWLKRRNAVKEGEQRRAAINEVIDVKEVKDRYNIDIEIGDAPKQSKKGDAKCKAGLKWLKEAYEAVKKVMIDSLYSEKRGLSEADKNAMEQRKDNDKQLANRLGRYFFEQGAGGLEGQFTSNPNELYRQVCDKLGIDFNDVRLFEKKIKGAPNSVVDALSRCPASTFGTWLTPEEETVAQQLRNDQAAAQQQAQQNAVAQAAQAQSDENLQEAAKRCKWILRRTDPIDDVAQQEEFLRMAFSDTTLKNNGTLATIVQNWKDHGLNIRDLTNRCPAINSFRQWYRSQGQGRTNP
jgi:hypothetical protein